MKIDIPVGVKAGTVQRIVGKGEHGIDAPDGDLLVEFEVVDKNTKESRRFIFGVLATFALIAILGVTALTSRWIYNSNNNNVGNLANVPNQESNGANTPANKAPNETNVTESKSKLSDKKFINSIGMEFVRIPSGSFKMGSPQTEKDRRDDESPQHDVKIDYDFYMSKYEVTQAQWKKVMGNNPSKFNGDKLPVERVSWNEAKEFIQKLNDKNDGYEYRLPTEAEWEYAARAGKTTAFAFGEILSTNQANFGSGAEGKTKDVGSYKPNEFKVYDMHGNVREWVEDIYNEQGYQRLPVDGSANTNIGNSDLRILRGGSYFDNDKNCRSAFREKDKPSAAYSNYGFRVVARPK